MPGGSLAMLNEVKVVKAAPPGVFLQVLDLPRGAKRRAGDADRPNESEIESLTHTQQSTFTRWLIKPTSEARNTGAATPATHTVYPPR